MCAYRQNMIKTHLFWCVCVWGMLAWCHQISFKSNHVKSVYNIAEPERIQPSTSENCNLETREIRINLRSGVGCLNLYEWWAQMINCQKTSENCFIVSQLHGMVKLLGCF